MIQLKEPLLKLMYLFLFLCVCFPGTLKLLKTGIVVLLVLVFSFLFSKLNRFSLDFFYMTMGMVCIGAVFTFLGLVKYNLGAHAALQAYVIYPVFLFVLVVLLANMNFVDSLNRFVSYSSIFIGITALMILLRVYGIFPGFPQLGIEQTVYSNDDGFGLGLNTTASCFFLGPFLVSSCLSKNVVGVEGVISFIALAILVIFSLMTGRRTLMVVLILAPFMTLFTHFLFFKGVKNVNLKRLFLGGAVLMLALSFSLSYVSITTGKDLSERFQTLIDYNERGDTSIDHKFIQNEQMIDGWSKAPLFGHGFGAVVEGVISSNETPWAYESTFHLLLHNAGVIGFMSYFFAVMTIYYGLYFVRRKGESVVPLTVGLTAFLVGSITNPYLGKLDSLWVLALPLAYALYYKAKFYSGAKYARSIYHHR